MNKKTEQDLKELSAFPSGYSIGSGLTKREYFAGLAMQGMLANDKTSEMVWDNGNPDKSSTEQVVSMAVEFADELLKQLGE